MQRDNDLAYRMIAEREGSTVKVERESPLIIVAKARIWASDLLEACRDLTLRNVERHGFASRVTVTQGDLFAPGIEERMSAQRDRRRGARIGHARGECVAEARMTRD